MLQRIVAFSFLLVVLLGIAPTVQADTIVWDDGGTFTDLWSDMFNWKPDGLPGSSDDLQIGVNGEWFDNYAPAANDTTLLNQNYTVNSVLLGNGADIINSPDGGVTSFQLTVNNGIQVGNTVGNSVVTLYDAPSGFFPSSLNALGMDIIGGKVTLNSISDSTPELAILSVDSLSIFSGAGTLSGNGQVLLHGNPASPTTQLSNNGTISAGYVNGFFLGAPPATTLKIQATTSNSRFDWDGVTEGGVINVRGNATLDIDMSLTSENFNGTLNLAAGSTFNPQKHWQIGPWGLGVGGQLNANTPSFNIVPPGQSPTPGPAARITGRTLTLQGGEVAVSHSWDTLQFDSAFIAATGRIIIHGTMIFNRLVNIQPAVEFDTFGQSSFVINAPVKIATPNFNLDGNIISPFFRNHTTINAGGSLDLVLGAGADEDFDHTILMNGGVLEVTTADNDWSLTEYGDLNVAGGTFSFINGDAFDIEGDINVTANSTLKINAVSEYHSGANVVIEAGSTIIQNAKSTIAAGATFSGAGSIKNSVGSTLRLLGNADIQVQIVNEGTLVLDNFAGQTTGLNFEQTATGIWDLQLGGLATGSFDQMLLFGSAQLDGTLDLSTILGFTPSLGDTFNILSASGGVAGMFSSILQPGAMPTNLLFDVNYLGSIVQLEVIDPSLFTADFDNDGDVDDLAKWQSDFGGSGSDADGDGDSDGADFLAWQQQLGSGVSAVASSTSVPEPSTLFLVGIAASFGLLMPRCRKEKRSRNRF